MSDSSPLPLVTWLCARVTVEEATCHVFVLALSSLWPKVSRTLTASEEGEGRMKVCCPFSSLFLFSSFYPILVPVCTICTALYTSEATTLIYLTLGKAFCTCNSLHNTCSNRYRTFIQPYRHTYVHACSHTKWCSLLGWPLNAFDTHYQLSLMWN